MGYRELITALRTQAEEKLGLILRETEEEIAGIRETTARRIGEMRMKFERMRAGAVNEEAESLLMAAKAEARMIRLQAEKELTDRLYGIAAGSLPLLRKKGYGDVFGALVEELPSCEWGIVRINPGDMELARQQFPSASLMPDPAISGGIDVMTPDGRVQAINTLEKRLENSWPDILPQVVRKIHELCNA